MQSCKLIKKHLHTGEYNDYLGFSNFFMIQSLSRFISLCPLASGSAGRHRRRSLRLQHNPQPDHFPQMLPDLAEALIMADLILFHQDST